MKPSTLMFYACAALLFISASPASPVMAKFYKGGAEGLLQITDNEKHQPHQPHQPAKTLNSGGAGHGMNAANMHVEEKLRSDGRTWQEARKPAEPAATLRARSPRDKGRCTENVISVEGEFESKPCPTVMACDSDAHTGGPEPTHNQKRHKMVRRLLPWECMRLMSAPDDFKWPEGITKTAMYRIIGNGQTSLLTHLLAECLRRADPGSQTAISLFCGGGVGDCGIHGKFWSYTPEKVEVVA